jgi:hypothetical protein
LSVTNKIRVVKTDLIPAFLLDEEVFPRFASLYLQELVEFEYTTLATQVSL